VVDRAKRTIRRGLSSTVSFLARDIPNESLREIDPKRVFIVQLADV
jgi:hypothetical protein